jgi:hypothetical protein
MLHAQQYLNVDTFLGSNTNEKANDDKEKRQHNKSKQNMDVYIGLNTIALIFHLGSVIAIAWIYEATLKDTPKDVVFVSPIARLRRTSHALINADSDASTDISCSDIKESPQFKATTPANREINAQLGLFPPRTKYRNFMPRFNFDGTTTIQYNIPGYELNLDLMIMSFCLISFIFQLAHMQLLRHNTTMPRFMHYLEYAFSSPLMVMVMAVNVGIDELFTVISLGALFCGMNITGMCAEVMIHFAGYINEEQRPTYLRLCGLTHLFGWVLFIFAMAPLWAEFDTVINCSKFEGIPDYGQAAIILESILFSAFGLLQAAGLLEKGHFIHNQTNPRIKFHWFLLRILLYPATMMYTIFLNSILFSGCMVQNTPSYLRGIPPYIQNIWRNMGSVCNQGTSHSQPTENTETSVTYAVQQTNIICIPPAMLFKYDCWHALLSMTAKILLAFLLIAPAMEIEDRTNMTY